MRALVQRVTEASVTVENRVVGRIGAGLLILLGVRNGDTLAEVQWVAEKCAHLRIFEDDNGCMNRSLLDRRGAALVVSQFTLYADCRKGRRPSFMAAAPPRCSEPLYEAFVQSLRDVGVAVDTGIFGARMSVSLVNDGPVTVLVERNGVVQ